MIDRVEIKVRGGNGGAGIVSFRREKFVPRGGPDGGDGADGGSVVLVADESVRTLKEIGRRRIFQAPHGRSGEGGKRHGRRGESLVLKVPPGTEVRRIEDDGTHDLIGELLEPGAALVVVKGGAGGWGNARFASSVRRAPRIAQKGQRGEEVHVVLDLKLLADVGIAGLPNAGKSTLLRALSAARPKVADYPFTTLEPSLGVVEHGWESFVMADIPGLIEGAHEGAGLGLDFLRHIERTKVVLYLVDGTSYDPLADLRTVEAEVREYGRGVAERPRLVAVNKIDVREVRTRQDALRALFGAEGIDVLFFSAAAREGLAVLVDRVAGMVATERERTACSEASRASPTVSVPVPKGDIDVRRENGVFRVDGERAIAFAEMMPVDTDEGLAELWRRFRRWGVYGALRRAGARAGDRVRLGDVELEMES
jgi:GTP-binding protein